MRFPATALTPAPFEERCSCAVCFVHPFYVPHSKRSIFLHHPWQRRAWISRKRYVPCTEPSCRDHCYRRAVKNGLCTDCVTTHNGVSWRDELDEIQRMIETDGLEL